MTMCLKLKAITAHPAVGLQGNIIISIATEQLTLEKVRPGLMDIHQMGPKIDL